MTGSSVLFDAPGPVARRRSLIASVIGALAIAGGLLWMFFTLNAPRGDLPGYFDPSRWDIFADPTVWRYIFVAGVWGTLRAALTAAAPTGRGSASPPRWCSSSSAACPCCS